MSDLRRQILDASVEIVAEQGVRALSFREVARRAGVSHQAPYHHFGNHHGILEAIAREGFAGLADAMTDAGAAAGPDPLDALTAAGVAYVNFAYEHVGHFRVMFQRSLVDLESSEIEEAARTHATLVRLSAEAQAGGYGAELHDEDMALVCWSTVHGFATLLIEGILQTKHHSKAHAVGLSQRVVSALSGLLRT